MPIFRRTLAQNLEEVLKKLLEQGANPETIRRIQSLPEKEKSLYIGHLRKNPNIQWSELQSIVHKPKEKQLSQLEKSIISDYTKEYSNWALAQLRKIKIDSTDQELKQILNEIYDWFQSVKRDNPNFQIQALPFNEAYKESKDWHEVMAGKGSSLNYKPFLRDEYGNIDDPSIVYNFEDGWFVVKISNENDLKVEGSKIHHCVSDYWYKVKNGQAHIYSIRNPFNKPQATIELDSDDETIKQIKSFSNSVPEQNVRYHIAEFLQDHDASFPEQNYEEPSVDWYAGQDPEQLVYSIYQEAYGVGPEYFNDEANGGVFSDWHEDYGIGSGSVYNEKDVAEVDIRDCCENILGALRRTRADLQRGYNAPWDGSYYEKFDDRMFEVIDALIDVAESADKKIMTDFIKYSRNMSLNYEERYKNLKNVSKVDELIYEASERIGDLEPEEAQSLISQGKMPYAFDYELLKRINETVNKDTEYIDLFQKITGRNFIDIPIINKNIDISTFDRSHPKLYYHKNDIPAYNDKTKFQPFEDNEEWKYPVQASHYLRKSAALDSCGKFKESDLIIKLAIEFSGKI